MPPMREGIEEGILKGLYKFKGGPGGKIHKAHIMGSGALLLEGLRAQQILAEDYDVSADVWSATSYKNLRQEALEVERWNMLHPTRRQKKPYVTKVLEKEKGPFVAVTDYMKLVPDQIDRWVPGGLLSLGTDGFGRSDTRPVLRRHFEVDAETITVAVLYQLTKRGNIESTVVQKAIKDLGVDPAKPNPIAV